MQVTVDDPSIEERIAEALPGWIERRPALRERFRRLLGIDQQPSPPMPGGMSFDAFLGRADEDGWVELVDGEMHAMSPAGLEHQQIVSFLDRVLGLFVERHDLGIVLTAPFLMRLGENAREPDILFVAAAHRDRLRPTYLDGPADLVVEVLSPESIGRDRGEKYVEYEAAGVPEYWLIDPQRQAAEFHLLDAEGRYRATALDAAGRHYARSLPGFWLEPAWLWHSPLPPVLQVMRALGVI